MLDEALEAQSGHTLLTMAAFEASFRICLFLVRYYNKRIVAKLKQGNFDILD